ncbi:MAG: SulP family inorganic anion transporter [Chitinophagales bacterium]|nr:SulP family inorganic anion transporter [Bacteroidota bacterium]
MQITSHRFNTYLLSFLKHDVKSSVTVFFVALPLCLGISLGCGAPLYAGLIAGVVGGIFVPLISRSQLSVSGPAAGLTSICAAIILSAGNIDLFFLAVMLAGVFQILLGVFKLGGFTQFIPSAVIKGMLSAIGIMLIAKQIPFMLGYDQPDFWTNQLFNIFTFNHGFEHIGSVYQHSSGGAILIACLSLILLIFWKRNLSKKIPYLPSSFVIVFFGAGSAFLLNNFIPALALNDAQFVNIPENVFKDVHFPDFNLITTDSTIWKNAVVICFVASLETLLSIAAIDKLDPFNRITPQNRELVAQGAANCVSGFIGGLPITAVIVRSSANAEAGAKTKWSAILHGVWLLLAIIFLANILNTIPYCVLAVLLISTGYNLAKPKMIKAVYQQGREQFLPFIVTLGAILISDLLIGVLIGVVYAIYFLIKHTYEAGFTIKERTEGHTKHFTIELALNVSFLNKKRIQVMLDKLPVYAIVEIIGTDSIYIDRDVLEIFQEFKTKAHNRHIQLIMKDIPEVPIIELH